MKNQKINYKLKIYCLLFFLSITFGMIGQEVIREEGFNYSGYTFREDSLKSRYLFDSGLEKYRLEEIMMPAERYPAGSLSTKTETIKSGDEWNIHRVHSGKLFSDMSDRSLALDANGKPHIAYGQTHLYYAWYDEEWHIETVDDSWDVGWYASLAMDSDGYPHISYYDRDPNGDLKYAFKDANGWNITTVDAEGTVGLFTSIALDENNHPYICYFDQTNGNLKYAQWVGSQWHIETVDNGGDVGEFNSLALGQNGTPHISYFDYTNGHLKYATHSGGSWQIQVIDNSQNVGLFTSIALDNNDQPHISYFDYANGNLKYVARISGQWEIITVDNGTIVGVHSSLAIDANGNPHIGYADFKNENLKYAVYNGNEWIIQRLTPVDYFGPSEYEGLFTSLALDSDNHPHISYAGVKSLTGSRFGLRYTFYDGSEWQRDVVDNELKFEHTSIAIDNFNNPHIGYIKSDHAMGYADYDKNQWSFESFLPEVGVVCSHGGSERFLALDSNSQPHLIMPIKKPFFSFGDSPYPSFIYSWYEDNNWHNDTVLIDNWNWRSYVWTSSLVLDQFDMPHICLHLEYGELTSTTSQFKYIYRNGNQWYSSTIDGALPVGMVHNSLTIDSEGNPHISYRKSGLNYARLVQNEWDIQIVDPDGCGEYNSLKLDADNFPHISYYNKTGKVLQYAYWSGTDWIIEIVDNNGDVGKYTSLALDANNYPHISYYDETNGNLKYAYWDGSLWQIETVDSYRNVGMYTSLALDANDNLHISYYDASFGDLKYASKKVLEANHTITASATENGSITPSGEVQVEYGNEQVFTITPGEGFRVAFIRIDGTEIDLAADENWDPENGEYTFSNVTEAHTIEVGFENATAIKEVKAQNELKVYPNPAKNELWIEFNYQGNDSPVIVLQNLQGQTLKQISFNDIGSMRVSMPIQNLASGVYLLTIRGEQVFPVRKVMIEK